MFQKWGAWQENRVEKTEDGELLHLKKLSTTYNSRSGGSASPPIGWLWETLFKNIKDFGVWRKIFFVTFIRSKYFPKLSDIIRKERADTILFYAWKLTKH